jgi:hypothetical protein
VWVIPDTTALFADPFLRGTPWIVIFRLAEEGELRVATPEVVVLETVNHRHSKTVEALHTYQKACRRLRGLDIPANQLHLSADELTRTYEKQLRERLERIGDVQPVPAVSHDVLVRRAVRKSKPFAKAGTGYRDALIFETVAVLVEQDDVVFISNNYADFCASADIRHDGTRAIHPDLVEVLLERGIDSSRVRIFPDAAAFVRNEIAHDMTAWLVTNAGDVEALLLEAVSERHVAQATKLVEEYLYDTWPELGVEVMTSNSVEDMVVEEVADVGEFRVESAQTDDGLIIRGKVTAHATLTVNFGVEVYFDHEWFPYERNTESTSVEVRMTAQWNRETDQLNVTEFEGPFGGYIELDD